MLTIKEIRTIKKVLKDYDLYCIGWFSDIASFYQKVKKYDVDELKDNMNKKIIQKIDASVKTAQAYHDLIYSFEKMMAYTESVAPVNYVYVNNIKMEHRACDLDYLYFTCNSRHLARVNAVYNELEKSYADNSTIRNKVLIVLLSTLYYQSCHRTESNTLWDIMSRVEEIKAAEEKHGEKFFVNDYLYDTFIHPELFESYGVYKKGEVFSMNKSSIIQDNL